jgi:hypothetical protein
VSLSASELARIRAELGYNVLTVGAEPYISYHALFDVVIQPYLQAGTATTSATAVTAATSPTPVTLTLTSATGFSAGVRVVIDVDARQEVATIQSLSGTSMVVHLSKAHSGTYPVTVEGGETIVRGILRQLDRLTGVGGQLESSATTSGIKKVDEIEFFGESSEDKTAGIQSLISYWRDELASALGVVNLRDLRGGQLAEVY